MLGKYAQGSLEYLLIIGAAILVVAVVITGLSGLLGTDLIQPNDSSTTISPLEQQLAESKNEYFFPMGSVYLMTYTGSNTTLSALEELGDNIEIVVLGRIGEDVFPGDTLKISAVSGSASLPKTILALPVKRFAVFSGSGRIDISRTLDLNFNTDDFTITFWVKTTTPANSSSTAVLLSNGTYYSKGWAFFAPRDSAYIEMMHSDGTNNNKVHYYPHYSLINDGKWHNLTLTMDYNGSHYLSSLFIDAVKRNSYADKLPALGLASSGKFVIGATFGSSYYYYYTGSVDEILLFKRILSSEEIQAIYDSNREPYTASISNLVAYWNFDGSSIDFLDKSGNGNNGTATNVIIESEN